VLETAQAQGERAELDAVLRSGVLNRAPHLVSFLTYICEQYFAGRAGQIKEYTIGVEALGRGPTFDPKKDSIVRVEAHRLRKRLSEYYGAAGAGHAIRITIPSGQYIPHFLANGTGHLEAGAFSIPPSLEPPLSAALPATVLPNPPGRRLLWPRIAAVLSLFAVSALILSHLPQKRKDTSPPADEVWNGVGADPLPAEFRLLAGYHGQPFADRQGRTWSPDAYFSGGRSLGVPVNHRIEGVADPNLFRTERSGAFRYVIPLGKGTYELHLYFAETEYGPGNPRGGGESSRTLNLTINGVERLHDFDALAESGGPNRLHVRVFKDVSPAADGKLRIAFLPSTAAAFVNAIEIVPSQPGLIRPVRIVAQDRSVTDSEGRFWSADEYFLGGNSVLRRNPVLDTREKELYRGERYGHFAYYIPLAPGKYRLTLHFAETWFGSPESNRPAPGSRIFNVFANGVALLQDFEIAAKAGLNRAYTAAFDNLQPNAQGVLSLEFVPVRNYAEVNAIEVVETE
jgi:hypothetical protein